MNDNEMPGPPIAPIGWRWVGKNEKVEWDDFLLGGGRFWRVASAGYFPLTDFTHIRKVESMPDLIDDNQSHS